MSDFISMIDDMISQEVITYQSNGYNRGKPTPLTLYTARCEKCNKEAVTVNVIDGPVDQASSTVLENDAVVKLHSAKCIKCNWEKYY